MTTPRIYVACLASYNNGVLHGKWIEANQSVDAIENEIQEMLKESKEPDAEEYAIHDFEGFGEIKLKEYQDIETISELAEALDKHGRAFELFYENESFDSVSDAVSAFEERYYGEYKTKSDWASTYLEETGQLSEIPGHLQNYFDFESYARDAELGGEIMFLEDGYNCVYVFHN